MELDLSSSAVINAAGGLLFLALGASGLAFAAPSRRGRILCVFAVAFGATYVAQNLLELDALDLVGALVLSACAATATVTALVLAHELVRGAGPPERRVGLAMGVAGAVYVTYVAFALGPQQDALLPVGARGQVAVLALAAQQVSLLPFLAATALAFRDAVDAGGRTAGPACLGLAFGPFIVFLFLATPGILPYAGDRPTSGTLEGVGFAVDLFAVAAVLPFARGTRAPELERIVFPVLVAAGLLGLAFAGFAPEAAQGSYYGAYGVARTLGALVLAWGIARLGLLGTAATRPAVRRGAGAMGALAVLLIVAQVLQNFLEARYGLLVGSVVAGAVLFLANPLQRAFERAAEGHASTRWGRGPGAVLRREAAYLDAARIALQDRRLSRAEELRLHRLAEELGIGAGRAHELLTSAGMGSGLAADP